MICAGRLVLWFILDIGVQVCTGHWCYDLYRTHVLWFVLDTGVVICTGNWCYDLNRTQVL